MAGLYQMAIFFRNSFHLIEDGNVKLAKLIINSKAPANIIYFPSNTGKMYSYSDTGKSKALVSFALTLNEADFHPLSPPIHAHKCKHSSFSNNFHCTLCETHGSNYVSSASKPVST